MRDSLQLLWQRATYSGVVWFCVVLYLRLFFRYVVVNDIVVEANAARNSELATWGFMSGFVVMMALDVALG